MSQEDSKHAFLNFTDPASTIPDSHSSDNAIVPTDCFGCAIMPLIAYSGTAFYLQWKKKYIGYWPSFVGTTILLALAGHHFKTHITEKFYIDENNAILPIKKPQ